MFGLNTSLHFQGDTPKHRAEKAKDTELAAYLENRQHYQMVQREDQETAVWPLTSHPSPQPVSSFLCQNNSNQKSWTKPVVGSQGRRGVIHSQRGTMVAHFTVSEAVPSFHHLSLNGLFDLMSFISLHCQNILDFVCMRPNAFPAVNALIKLAFLVWQCWMLNECDENACLQIHPCL